jgi:stress response protein YsnF
MGDNENPDVVVPVISEELHADAVPVVTGGVRVTKHVHTHDEVLEQELRKSHVEVKRVKTNRVVDGPQPVQRTGNTLVIPVVSEVLRVEKQWVVTEEIHIIQTEERETVQQTVPVNREEAQIERLDESGNPTSTLESGSESAAAAAAPRGGPAPLLERSRGRAPASSGRRVRSILKPESGDRST